MTDTTSREWSYEQFVQALQEGAVKSVMVFGPPPPPNRIQAIIQTHDDQTHRVMIPADSDWLDLLAANSIEFSTVEDKVAAMGMGPQVLNQMLLRFLLPRFLAFLGLSVLLEALHVESLPLRLASYAGLYVFIKIFSKPIKLG
jgi:hypothetical protein